MLPKPQKRNNHPPSAGPTAATPTLGLVGISVRAAAEALSGLPIDRVLDLFCDYDTTLACPDVCFACPNGERFIEHIRAVPNRPLLWLPIGGLDLQPNVWAALAKSPHPILGCSLDTVQFCKSPSAWSAAVEQVHPQVLPVRYQPHSPPGRWFLKSAWPTEPAPWFWQQACDGVLHSVLFLATADGLRLVGGSRLYVTSDHRYLGNLASSDRIEPPERATLETIFAALQTRTDLRGLIGIDYMLNAHVWPLEINPRPTASVEVVAQQLGRNLYWEHVLACCDKYQGTLEAANSNAQPDLVSATSPAMSLPIVVAKRVLYNGDEPLVISPAGFARLSASHRYQSLEQWYETWTSSATQASDSQVRLARDLRSSATCDVRVADIPWPNSHIPPREPICTLLARITTADALSNIAARPATRCASHATTLPAADECSASLAEATWAMLEQLESLVIDRLQG